LCRDFVTIESFEVGPTDSYTQFNLRALLSTPNIVDDVANSLAGFSKKTRPTVASMHCNAILSERYAQSTLNFTDGFKSNENTGFGVYVPHSTSFGHRLREPACIFSAETQAINFERSNPPGEYLILTDSLSSIEALIAQAFDED
jgi:hypothetical protein